MTSFMIVLLTKYHIIGVVKSRWAGHVARTGGRAETLPGFWWANPKERDHLEDLGVGRIVLKRNLKKE
jgi:hypothetical protein